MSNKPLTTESRLPLHRPSLEIGRMQRYRGHLHQANRLFEQAIAEKNAPGIGMSHLAISELHYEWNNLDTAAFHIQQGLTLSQQSQNLTTQITGYRLWARLQQVFGNFEAANEAMRQAHDLAETHQLPPKQRLENAEWELLLAINRHDLQAVAHWWRNLTIPERFHPVRSFIYARALIALGKIDVANAYLDSWLTLAVQDKQQYAVITLLVQQALVAVHAPHAFIIDALTLAKKERFVRTFIDEGSKLLPLLYTAQSYAGTAVYAEELINATHQTPKTSTTLQMGLSQQKSAADLPALQGDEMHLLRLIMSGHSHHSIADQLSLPYDTVKVQIDALQQKLGIQNGLNDVQLPSN